MVAGRTRTHFQHSNSKCNVCLFICFTASKCPFWNWCQAVSSQRRDTGEVREKVSKFNSLLVLLWLYRVLSQYFAVTYLWIGDRAKDSYSLIKALYEKVSPSVASHNRVMALLWTTKKLNKIYLTMVFRQWTTESTALWSPGKIKKNEVIPMCHQLTTRLQF